MLSYHLSDEQFESLFDGFETPADKRKKVDDEDLAVPIEKHILDVAPHWESESLRTAAGTSVIPTATVAIRRPDRVLIHDAAIVDGPVDALFKAVERVTGIGADLRGFAVCGVTFGRDAEGAVSTELESDDRTFGGRAASTDIIEASAEACINAVSVILTRRNHHQPRGVIGRTGGPNRSGRPR
jgi:2-isopropylmalate synthase